MRLKRKWLVRLHMKSGNTIVIFTRDLTQRKNGNDLIELGYPGAGILDFLRLDDIEAITSRRSWTRWWLS